MALPIWQGTIVRDNGDVVPNCEYSVVLESTGSDATIYSDRAGTTPKTAPYFADSNGLVQFYADMGDYRIVAEDSGTGFTRTFRYEPIFSPDSDFDTDAGTEMLIEQLNLRKAIGVTTVDVSGSSNIALTAAQVAAEVIIFTGTTTGNINVSTPTDAAQKWTIINNDDGGFVITFKTNTGTGVDFEYQSDEREVYSDGTNVKNLITNIRVGDPVYSSGLTGAIPPPKENFIKLEADLTGAGEYNEGKLTNQQSSGSAPLEVITADIDDADSPMNGVTVNLVGSENRYLKPGTSPGTAANDQMQQITGTLGRIPTGGAGSGTMTGAFSGSTLDPTGVFASGSDGDSYNPADFDSANSPNARTGTYTDVKNVQVEVYMRIK